MTKQMTRPVGSIGAIAAMVVAVAAVMRVVATIGAVGGRGARRVVARRGARRIVVGGRGARRRRVAGRVTWRRRRVAAKGDGGRAAEAVEVRARERRRVDARAEGELLTSGGIVPGCGEAVVGGMVVAIAALAASGRGEGLVALDVSTFWLRA